jgi:hypothetical protein
MCTCLPAPCTGHLGGAGGPLQAGNKRSALDKRKKMCKETREMGSGVYHHAPHRLVVHCDVVGGNQGAHSFVESHDPRARTAVG